MAITVANPETPNPNPAAWIWTAPEYRDIPSDEKFRYERTLKKTCPECKVEPGELCVSRKGNTITVLENQHPRRRLNRPEDLWGPNWASGDLLPSRWSGGDR